MSLQVWLPLNGDLKNQGLCNTQPSSTNYTSVDAGKIGKCIRTSSSSIDTGITSDIWDFTTKSISFGAWIKINKSELSTVTSSFSYDSTYCSAGGSIFGYHSYGGLALRWKTNNLYTDALSSVTIYGSMRDKSSNITNSSTYNIPFDTWTHVIVVVDRNTQTMKFYINGEKYGGNNAFNNNHYSAGLVNQGNFIINHGTWDSGNGMACSAPWYINDVRIYDHALSTKEIKEISKGLVLHYKMEGNSGPNLIENGYGDKGNYNWSYPSNIYDIFPSNTIGIVKSFIDNYTTNFIPIQTDHKYKIEMYVKASSSSGYTYPALVPYDIDKKWIQYHQISYSFLSSSVTKLAKALNPGDTKIYVESLSGWTTSTTNYYYHAAIFGYKDSTGHVYDDLTYTQDTPSFGSYSDKSNLDLTNNIITLKSAYTGAARPVGTTVCQSTEGATYWYPFNNINVTTITDWTYKSATFIPNNYNYLKYAKYFKYHAWAGAYQAGIRLTDVTLEIPSTYEYDCSGFGNDGTKVGDIAIAEGSPRYSQCLRANSTKIGTSTSTGMACVYSNKGLTTPSALTFTFWLKPINWSYQNSGILSTTANSYPSDYETSAVNQYDDKFRFNASDGTNVTVSATSLINDTNWHHYAFTFDGINVKVYKDGTLTSLGKSFSAAKTLGSFNKVFLGLSVAGGAWRQTSLYWSDFRMYATALSADDIKALYNTPISIDANGNIHAYEFKEG